MLVIVVTGTRPQIIKTVPVLSALKEKGIDTLFVHTGQHYDYEMAAQFIEDLSVQEPDYNLSVGSGTNAYQIYETIKRLAEILDSQKPDYLLTPGDTNSALAAGLVGFKMDIATCHLESGLRSNDMRMQAEVNRRLIDHGSAGLFAPTSTAVTNLEQESVLGQVFLTGDTMYDVLKSRLPVFSDIKLVDDILIEVKDAESGFITLTLHRRENADFPQKMKSIIKGLSEIETPIIFPIHPRTRKMLDIYKIDLPKNIFTIKPVSYDVMMGLVSASKLLITDSGGLQKEAYLLNTPCVTIRDNTEWVETIESGANVLTSTEPTDIVGNIHKMYDKNLKNDPSVYGDGNASEKIAAILSGGEIRIRESSML